MTHPPKARCKWAESVMKLYHNHYVIHHPWLSYLWSFFNSPPNPCSLIDVQFSVKDHHFFFAAIFNLEVLVATPGSCNNEADDLMKPWEYTPKNLRVTWNLAILRFPKRNLLFQVSMFQVPCGRFRGCLGIIHPRKLTCPLKRDYFNRKYIFQPLILRGHVSFPGSIAHCKWEVFFPSTADFPLHWMKIFVLSIHFFGWLAFGLINPVKLQFNQ